MELVGGAVAAREQQQPERHLGDDDRLRERDQVRDPGARGRPAVGDEPGDGGGEAGRDHEERDRVVRRQHRADATLPRRRPGQVPGG